MVFVKHRCNTRTFCAFFSFKDVCLKCKSKKSVATFCSSIMAIYLSSYATFSFWKKLCGCSSSGSSLFHDPLCPDWLPTSVSFKSTSCWHGASNGLRLTPASLSWQSHDHIKKHMNSWHQLVWTHSSSRIVVELVTQHIFTSLFDCAACDKMQKHWSFLISSVLKALI